MPEKIKNKEIISLIKKNTDEMQSINKAQRLIDKRIDNLNKHNNKFVDLMNQEYGWGNWQNVNVEDYTYMSREEIEAEERWYIIANPALRPKGPAIQDIKVEEALTKH